MRNLQKYLFIALITCISSTAGADSNNTPSTAEISGRSATMAEVQGTVEMKPSSEKAVWVAAAANTSLAQGDIIRTGEKSYAFIHINGASGNAVIELKENSQLTIVTLARAASRENRSTLLSLDIGEANIKTKNMDKRSVFEVKTPTSIIAAEGNSSSFMVQVEKEE